MIIKVVSAFFATFFFGYLFNIKKEHLFFTALGGGLSAFAYETFHFFHFGIYSSIFLAAIVFAFYAEVMARIKKTSVTTFAICALIPLVPGKGMYLTMLAMVNSDYDNALKNGIETLGSAGLLALGILIVSTLARLYTFKKTIHS